MEVYYWACGAYPVDSVQVVQLMEPDAVTHGLAEQGVHAVTAVFEGRKESVGLAEHAVDGLEGGEEFADLAKAAELAGGDIAAETGAAVETAGHVAWPVENVADDNEVKDKTSPASLAGVLEREVAPCSQKSATGWFGAMLGESLAGDDSSE